MNIRIATSADYIHICRSLQNKGIDYITTKQAKNDIDNNRLYIIENNGKIISQCALVPEPNYNYTAIKRMCVYNKKNAGCGIANAFVNYFVSNFYDNLGCTPWEDNGAMRHILEKHGFVYQYTFLENYCFYLLTNR